jgi:hypothetical protein
MMVYQKDTNELKIYDGASWITMLDTDIPPGVWVSTSVSISAGGWVLGNGTLTAAYTKVGQLVTYNVTLTVGSTTTYGTYMGFNPNFPAPHSSFTTQWLCSGCVIRPGVSQYLLCSRIDSATSLSAAWLSSTVPGDISGTSPVNVVSGVSYSWSGTYRSAA